MEGPITRHREGSVVSELFGPAVVGPSAPILESVQEEGQSNPPAGPTTQSIGKCHATTAEVQEQLLEDDKDIQNVFLNAMQLNRAMACEEREKDPHHDPSGVLDKFGWSDKQTILIKPMFGVFW